MRAAVLILSLAGTAAADDARKPPAPPPKFTLKFEPWDEPPRQPTDKVPGIGGIDALAKILVPPEHPDAQLWPYGMVIVPPETGDQNVLVPGTNQLPWWKPARTGPVSKELLDGIEGGVGKFIELLVPPTS